jgi:Kef-type K+ transport system membrane component KefB
MQLLLTLAAVLLLGRILGLLFRYVGQPPVIGEVVAGILLGPSVLGVLWPQAGQLVMPASVAPSLEVVAQLGVILYMFLVGLELDLAALRKHARATLVISQASIALPFILGASLALVLYPRLSAPDVPTRSFVLFVGVAMSITAFPVLSRILTDRGAQKTPLGILALACAALNDVAAWCLLAVVAGIAQAKLGGALVSIALTLAYILFMFTIVRPVAGCWLKRLGAGGPDRESSGLVLVALLVSALLTEAIGIHAIFGAFMLGAVIPHDSAVARTFVSKLEDLVCVLLLPAFFAFTGLRTKITLLTDMELWLICGLIIVLASVGKIGGALLAARFLRFGWRESASLGILMNTRGLMELVALNVGLDLKVITPTLFAMMVVMALVTTLATGPLFQRLSARANSHPPDFTSSPFAF